MENQQLIYSNRKIDGSKTWLLFLFFGWSYGSLGSMGKQILFYLTAGGCGLWALYVMFTLNKKIKEANKKIALQCGFTTDELLMNGLI